MHEATEWMNIAHAVTAAGEGQDFGKEQAWAPTMGRACLSTIAVISGHKWMDLSEQLRCSVGVTQAAVLAAAMHLAKEFGQGISLAVFAEGAGTC